MNGFHIQLDLSYHTPPRSGNIIENSGWNYRNTVDGQNPVPPSMIIIPLFIGFSTIPGGAGFLPSTVASETFGEFGSLVSDGSVPRPGFPYSPKANARRIGSARPASQVLWDPKNKETYWDLKMVLLHIQWFMNLWYLWKDPVVPKNQVVDESAEFQVSVSSGGYFRGKILMVRTQNGALSYSYFYAYI